jgi:hypothetical protein
LFHLVIRLFNNEYRVVVHNHHRRQLALSVEQLSDRLHHRQIHQQTSIEHDRPLIIIIIIRVDNIIINRLHHRRHIIIRRHRRPMMLMKWLKR